MSTDPSTAADGIVVAACGLGPAPRLARGLAAQGLRVALLSDQPADDDTAGLYRVPTHFGSRAAVDQAFAQAAQRLGGIGQVVLSALPPAAAQAAAITDMAQGDWAAASHATVKAVLYGLQAAGARMSTGGAITLLGPNVSLVGAAGLVPLCAAVEAQRSLAKAVARQWGGRGIRINWVAIASREFDAAFGALRLPDIPELGPPPPALGRRIDIEADVLPLLRFLGSAGAAGMTGATINLDGGDWMLP